MDTNSDLYITNMVVQACLNVDLTLNNVIRRINDAQYKPFRFSGIIWNHKKIQASCLLFNNGKLVCHGTRNMDQARLCIRQYARLIEKLGYPVRLTNIRLVTASAVGNIKKKLDLVSVARFFTHAQYEPELFNACMLKVDRLNFSIFSSGKIVVTGIKEIKLISQVVLPTMLEIALV